MQINGLKVKISTLIISGQRVRCGLNFI